MKKEQLKELLDGLPATPGVYLMKDLSGQVIYVGKAGNLHSRVRQYFAASTSDTRHFVQGLKEKLSDIETVITSTEKEAILLEHNLIQRHMPRYNIRLTDDKHFLSIKLNLKTTWPRPEMARRPKKDGAHYFGPYHSAGAARETLKLIGKHFRLRSCTDRAFKNRARPCLKYQIKRCMGPCCLDVDAQEYRRQAEYVELFLRGRRDDLMDMLKKQMAKSAEALDYERAAVLRDQIAAVEATLAPQRITDFKNLDQDIIGIHREADQVEIAVLEVVGGRLSNRVGFFFKKQRLSNEEILSSFVVQRYSNAQRFPDEVVLSKSLTDAVVLSEILSDARGKKVKVIYPKRGSRVDQIKMADLNAKHSLEKRRRDKENIADRLEDLRIKLKLPITPTKIECVDIAHLGGTNTVGAIGVVIDGVVNRKAGRTYKVDKIIGGDDYRAISEVLRRRFVRAQKGLEGWEPPDLLLIDGGRGQLAVAVAVLKELNVVNQPVAALAKERTGLKTAATDRVFLPGRVNPIMLRGESSPLHMLAAARDEAHRLANTYQRKLRQKRTITSKLDEVHGVGPKTRRALLRKFGSLKRIGEATTDDLVKVNGVGIALAKTILEALKKH